MRHPTGLLARVVLVVLGACGQPAPSPVLPQPQKIEPTACDRAAELRARAIALRKTGHLDRALRALRAASDACATDEGTTAERALERELGHGASPPPNPDVLLALARDAAKRGDGPAERALLDRTLHALEIAEQSFARFVAMLPDDGEVTYSADGQWATLGVRVEPGDAQAIAIFDARHPRDVVSVVPPFGWTHVFRGERLVFTGERELRIVDVRTGRSSSVAGSPDRPFSVSDRVDLAVEVDEDGKLRARRPLAAVDLGAVPPLKDFAGPFGVHVVSDGLVQLDSQAKGESAFVDVVARKDIGRFRSIGGDEGPSVRPSPDGSVLAVVYPSGTSDGDYSRGLALVDRKGARPARLVPKITPAAQPLKADFAWTPDGKTIAVALDGGRAALVDAATGRVRAAKPSKTHWGEEDHLPEGIRPTEDGKFFCAHLTSEIHRLYSCELEPWLDVRTGTVLSPRSSGPHELCFPGAIVRVPRLGKRGVTGADRAILPSVGGYKNYMCPQKRSADRSIVALLESRTPATDGDDFEDVRVVLVDAKTGKPARSISLGNLERFASVRVDLAWMRKDTRLVIAFGNELLFVDVAAARVLRRVPSAMSHLEVGADDRHVRHDGVDYDAETGERAEIHPPAPFAVEPSHAALVRMGLEVRQRGATTMVSVGKGLLRVGPSESGALVLPLSEKAGVAFLEGGRIELLGEASKLLAASGVRCLVGARVVAHEICAERLVAPGGLARAVAGDASYLDP